MEKYAFIMRGIPGSGKSIVAKMIARGCFPNLVSTENSPVCGLPSSQQFQIHSTDDLCMVGGEYRFDVELAGERHAQNLQNFKDSCAAGKPCVIVDNTNVKTEQYLPYIKAAEAEGYRVVIVELPHPAPIVAAQRNAHGVPIEVINQMTLDWEPAQHCATVAKVAEAAEIVKTLQKQARTGLVFAFAVGMVFGAVLACVLWIL